jgi:hypothetical protein
LTAEARVGSGEAWRRGDLRIGLLLDDDMTDTYAPTSNTTLMGALPV